MTRRRHGSRAWAISLGTGLLAAMLLSGPVSAARPTPSGTVALQFTGCAATVDVVWSAVSGVKTYQVSLENNVNGTGYNFGEGTAHRSGTSSGQGTLVAETTKTFTARIRFYDRLGAFVTGFSSSPVDAACV